MQSLHPLRAAGPLLALAAALVSPATAQDALVLGGGGSRGLAHAGAIEGLARKGFRPDLVVGTSMGAIMGALYAAGFDPDSIWRVSSTMDWQELFAFPPLRTLPDGEAERPFLNLGVRVDRRRYSEGLIADRYVNRDLVRLLFDADARARGDFDRLPIRFRSVAADLGTGKAVALGRGGLARAVRASMSVPGLFAPIIDETGRYLVDGGIADYLPVGTALDAGARFVVTVDVIRPTGAPGRLNPFQIGLRAFRLTLRNARPPAPEPDVEIVPDIDPDLSAAIFLRDATPLLESGRRAALRAFPDSLARRGRPPLAAPLPAPVSFGSVRVHTNDPALAPLVERAFAGLAGAPYGVRPVLDAADRLYATGFFDGIWPSVDENGDLAIRADAQVPLLTSSAAGYDDDRGPRLYSAIRARHGTTELALAGRLGSLESRASLSVRRPLLRRPELAPGAGIAYRESDVRLFDGERVVAETEVRRTGGWIGLVWTAARERGELVAAFRGDRIDQDQGEDGTALGFSLRAAGREPNARVVGTPPVLEIERRWGDVAWSDIRARAALAVAGNHLRAALVASVAATSGAAPLDAWPALGDDDGVPGLRHGSHRGETRVTGGLDVAYPILLEGHVRLRLRAGAVAPGLDGIDDARWVTGGDVGLLWWAPFGRIAVGVGATRHGDWRVRFDIGPRF